MAHLTMGFWTGEVTLQLKCVLRIRVEEVYFSSKFNMNCEACPRGATAVCRRIIIITTHTCARYRKPENEIEISDDMRAVVMNLSGLPKPENCISELFIPSYRGSNDEHFEKTKLPQKLDSTLRCVIS